MAEFVGIAWKVIGLITVLLLFNQIVGSRLRGRWQFGSELAFAWALALLYFVIRGTMLGQEERAYANAKQIIEAEKAMGIYWEKELQGQILDSDFLVWLANWVYVWWHWPLIVAVLAWLYIQHPQHYTTYRNAFIISGVIGLVIFALYPAAPPRFMDGVGLHDTVQKRAIFSNILLPPSLTNLYAAMPSLHAGWNLLIGIALFRHARSWPIRSFGILMPVFMAWSIVVTGNHYILDGVIGDLIAEVALAIAVLFSRRTVTSTFPEQRRATT
jgi:membrane-associated phospholipid phosphatase